MRNGALCATFGSTINELESQCGSRHKQTRRQVVTVASDTTDFQVLHESASEFRAKFRETGAETIDSQEPRLRLLIIKSRSGAIEKSGYIN